MKLIELLNVFPTGEQTPITLHEAPTYKTLKLSLVERGMYELDYSDLPDLIEWLEDEVEEFYLMENRVHILIRTTPGHKEYVEATRL